MHMVTPSKLLCIILLIIIMFKILLNISNEVVKIEHLVFSNM